jgi:hypothetical protein
LQASIQLGYCFDDVEGDKTSIAPTGFIAASGTKSQPLGWQSGDQEGTELCRSMLG